MEPIKCPKCGKINDGSLDFCIYCGSFFEDPNKEEQDDNIFFITPSTNDGKRGKKQAVRLSPMPEHLANKTPSYKKKNHRLAIILGYIFAILGGLIGFVFAIYLITRKDPVAKRHGLIQLVILILEYAMMAYMFMTGQIDINLLLNPFNMTQMNNMSQLYNSSQMNMTGSNNLSSLFGF